MLVYFMDTWSILLPFVIFYGHLVKFVVIWYKLFPFWYFVPRKIWQPCSNVRAKRQAGTGRWSENQENGIEMGGPGLAPGLPDFTNKNGKNLPKWPQK
jgi:hypothetical protein